MRGVVWQEGGGEQEEGRGAGGGEGAWAVCFKSVVARQHTASSDVMEALLELDSTSATF